MSKSGKSHNEPVKKIAEIKAEEELTEVELAKVAGGIPPRSGGAGMEI